MNNTFAQQRIPGGRNLPLKGIMIPDDKKHYKLPFLTT